MGKKERLAAIVADCFERRERGEPVDPENVIRAHPDLADELRSHFALSQLLDRTLAPGDDLPEGTPQEIGGEYRLVREIGRGGMGVVYEAVQVPMQRPVALKVLSASFVHAAPAVQRFQREARAAGKLHHTNIVPIHAMGQHAGLWYYAMELVDGRPLNRVVAELKAARDRPGESSSSISKITSEHLGSDTGQRSYFLRVAEMFAGVADALETAHKAGVIHRDIKPSNLLLDTDGLLMIVDFGLARLDDGGASMTITGDLVGTPIYMSPEQALAKRMKVDHRTDIYSLGATLYEVLTLRPPFQGESLQEICAQIVTKDPALPHRLNRHLPRDLETIVFKAMEKDRDKRYATAAELARDLQRFAEGAAIHARRIGPVGRTWRRVKRHKVRSALIAAVFFLAVGGAVFAVGAARERALRVELEYARLCAMAAEAMAVSSEGGLRWESQRHEHSARDLYSEAVALAPDRPAAYFGRALASGSPLDRRLHDVDEARARGLPARTYHLVRARLFGISGMRKEAGGEQERARAHTGATPIDDYFEARLLATIGQRKGALTLLDQAIAASRRGSAVRYLALRSRADVRARDGDLAGALTDLIKVQETGDDSVALRVRIASLWRRMGKDETANTVFSSALEEVKRNDAPGDWYACCQACWVSEELDWHARVTEQALARRPDVANLLVERARAFEARGQGAEQLAACEQALKLEPKSHRAHEFKGNALLELERFGDALAAYDLALKFQEHCAHSHNNRGLALFALGRFDEALAAFDRTLDLDPADPKSWTMRGETLSELEAYADARNALMRALELNPDFSPAYTGLGRLLNREGKHEEALAAHRRSAELDPEEAVPHFNVGITLRDLARLEEALAAFTRAVELNPGFQMGHYERAFALAKLGRLDESLVAAARAVELAPHDADAHHRHGWVLTKLGRHEEALVALEQALATDPGHMLAWMDKGIALKNLRRYEGALAAFDQAIRIDADHANAHHNRGNALLAAGRPEEALWAFTRAIELDPNVAVVHYNRANAFLALHRRSDALKGYEDAIALDDSLAKAHNNRGVVLLELRRYQDCLAACDRALELHPEHVNPRLNRGYALVALESTEEARKEFEEALRLTGHHPGLMNAIAWNLATSPDPMRRSPEVAAAYAERATKASPDDGNLWNTLGVALCEARRWTDAAAALETSMRLRSGGDAHDWFFVAIAKHKLGQEDAREWFDKAVAWMDEHSPDDKELERFRAEAEKALGIEAGEAGEKTGGG